MDNYFQIAKKIIEKASFLVLRKINKISKVSFKKGHFNLVTNVDQEVEELILKEINSNFPNHSVIAEESGMHKKDFAYVWFIDPIDGTTNFAHGYPCFCISIAFQKKGTIEFGLIKNPVTGELYSAIKDKGAKLNERKITVSKIRKLKDSLLVTGFPYDRKTSKANNLKNFCNLTMRTQGVRRDGAAAMDLCYVACGKLDGFWEIKLNPWDVAAGVLLVKEAGGRVTDFKGNDYDIFNDKIVATNGLIHWELLKHLK